MRAAVFQSAGAGLTPADRIDRLHDAIKGEVLDLVVCPELFASGYNSGDALLELVEPRDGPIADKIGQLARDEGTTIVYGYPERDGETIYNAAAVVDSTGECLANHRKIVLPPGFEPDIFTPGDMLTTFAVGDVRCCALICYEVEHPESVRAATKADAQVVIVPTALVDNWKSVAFQMMPTRAFENGVWLLYANHAGVENDASYIVAPDGKDAARAGAGEELITADLDMDRMSAMQARLPYLRDVERLQTIITSSP